MNQLLSDVEAGSVHRHLILLLPLYCWTVLEKNGAMQCFKTRKHVAAECRHDMRPSVQLPSVSRSGADSKLGLTMVMCSLQSAPEPPALDPPPVSKHDARSLWRFLTSSDLDLWPFHLKTGIPLTRVLENVYTNFDFCTFFFELRARGRDRRTDRQTDEQTVWQDA